MLPSWVAWSWQYKFLPQDLHEEEYFVMMVEKLHTDPENYSALELAVLGILKFLIWIYLLIHFTRNWTLRT